MLGLCRAYRLGLKLPESREDFFFFQSKLASFYSDQRLRFHRKKKLNGSTTLISMAKELNVSVQGENWHSGLYDVRVTWEVLKALFWKMEITTNHI